MSQLPVAPTSMDRLQNACSDSKTYPRNLVISRKPLYSIVEKEDRLKNLSSRLFVEERDASADFWQYEGNDFHHTRVMTRQHLREHLGYLNISPQKVPDCRFLFVQARHSKSKLLITKEMITDLLSYLQTMPAIITLLSSFGQDAGKDFQHCQFEVETKLLPSEAGLSVPELRRSGRVIEMCYVLRSVEPSTAYPEWHWTVKQTGIYHCFDVETGQTNWIIFKGSDLFKQRVMEATSSPDVPDLRLFGSTSASLGSALTAHLLFCDWAAEHWRWYTNHIEMEIQKVTRTKTFAPVAPPDVSSPSAHINSEDEIPPLSLRDRVMSFTHGKLSRNSTMKSVMQRLQLPSQAQSSIGATLPSEQHQNVQLLPQSESSKTENDSYYDCLQRIKFLEEKLNEALLVLKTTISVLEQLSCTYTAILNDDECPLSLRNGCRGNVKRFCGRINNNKSSLNREVLRLETLVMMIKDRKALLHSIIEWRSMQASLELAKQSNDTALKMESMTSRMYDIADKTEQETVSMRVITLVTLFFLPGTFISTLMSTDIVKFQNNREVYSSSALKLFLLTSIPLMFVTFVAWWVVYWWVKNREKVQRYKKQLQNKPQP